MLYLIDTISYTSGVLKDNLLTPQVSWGILIIEAKERSVEKLKQYLLEEFDVLLVQNMDVDDEEGYYDRRLAELIEEYGQEQRKAGYQQGWEDGMTDASSS